MTHDPIHFFVPGKPAPGGSKKAFVSRKTGRAIVVDDAKGNADWKARVAQVAAAHYSGDPLTGPLEVSMIFHLPRLKGHFGTGKHAARLKDSAPYYCTVKPDVLKLGRATEDACTGILWRDDATTVRLSLVKVYSLRPGVEIEVKRVSEVIP